MIFTLWLFMCFIYGYGCLVITDRFEFPTWLGALIAATVPFVLAGAFIEAFK